jgi:hypothetical protein
VFEAKPVAREALGDKGARRPSRYQISDQRAVARRGAANGRGDCEGEGEPAHPFIVRQIRLANALNWATMVSMRTWPVVFLVPLAACIPYGSDDHQPWHPPQDFDAGPPPEMITPPSGVPITGGTMILTHDGKSLVVADPDRDQIVTVDLAGARVTSAVALQAGDQPGRLVEDGAGRVHVALRKGGAIVTVVPGQTQIVDRTDVCPEPRGIAYEAPLDHLHVACAGGELVTLDATTNAIVRRVRLDPDLRDVVVSGDMLLVSRFRSAEVLTVDAQGQLIGRARMTDVSRVVQDPIAKVAVSTTASAEVAWHMFETNNMVLMVHQRHVHAALGVDPQQPQGYGDNGCPGATNVEAAVSKIAPSLSGPKAGAVLTRAILPVDASVDPTGAMVAVADVGESQVHVYWTRFDDSSDPCTGTQPPEEVTILQDPSDTPATAVVFLPNGELAVLYSDVPNVTIYAQWSTTAIVKLPGRPMKDLGRTLFHQATPSLLACASCHPEGHDDGQAWAFSGIGDRRTQDIGGHIMSRAPYHWSGDLADMPSLVHEVFENRMGGGSDPIVTASVGPWIDTIPSIAPSPAEDRLAAMRGKILFDSADVGCSGCHSGPILTNDQLVDVGTGGKFKAPSLRGLASRAPFLHSGCATSLADRFTPSCGGGDLHGHTSQLTRAQLDDLIAYLQTL